MPAKRRGAQIFNMMLKYCHFLPTYLILITPSSRNLLQILAFGQIEMLTISQPHSSGFMNAILSIQTYFICHCLQWRRHLLLWVQFKGYPSHCPKGLWQLTF